MRPQRVSDLDEVVVSFAGKKHWLWRAVDQDGFFLDVLVQSRRDKKAAKRLFRKLLKSPEVRFASDSPLEEAGFELSVPPPHSPAALHKNSRFLVKGQSFRSGKNYSRELPAPIHNRTPVILPATAWRLWVRRRKAEPDEPLGVF
jgi:hypothetical protein